MIIYVSFQGIYNYLLMRIFLLCSAFSIYAETLFSAQCISIQNSLFSPAYCKAILRFAYSSVPLSSETEQTNGSKIKPHSVPVSLRPFPSPVIALMTHRHTLPASFQIIRMVPILQLLMLSAFLLSCHSYRSFLRRPPSRTRPLPTFAVRFLTGRETEILVSLSDTAKAKDGLELAIYFSSRRALVKSQSSQWSASKSSARSFFFHLPQLHRALRLFPLLQYPFSSPCQYRSFLYMCTYIFAPNDVHFRIRKRQCKETKKVCCYYWPIRP